MQGGREGVQVWEVRVSGMSFLPSELVDSCLASFSGLLHFSFGIL